MKKVTTTWIEGNQEEENEIASLLAEVKKASEVPNPKKQEVFSFIDFQPEVVIDRAAGAGKGFWVRTEKGLPVEIKTPTQRAKVTKSFSFGDDFEGVVQEWEIN